ncbi:Gfo/Idh/MocA family oxidoreductase [Kineosporia sp. J2-2]|uniref:Gfo/Idh/MocA family oxidoreductase n=1 Tax=Kineosporia corallincola TaxID=2835133 RepID=A0ABS5THQ1_9ACTN|nr:Gfo/Idh/MocA family oxidoreductase [Kineosporia corallincola]MBT0769119.1 Gfo/Idh/MocA family oxidoreductase [Kineosporia corallincola]
MGEPVKPLRVGVIGAGKISGQYSRTLRRLPHLPVTSVADLDPARAQQLAAQHPGARTETAAHLLAADDVDLVLNLTVPAVHGGIALAALAAGKHVYGEKPLALTVAEGRAVLDAAGAAGLRVGCAPDTVLGTGIQTARALVDDGRIGVPVAATAFMTTPGHERWHPDPEFLYRPGGGPLLDMGPYYLTSLVHLLGPVASVTGVSSRPTASRVIGSGPRAGTAFDVEVDTHVAGLLVHASGAVSTLVMSFDVWAARLPRIEVYGSGGSLAVPDPNRFDGEVAIFTAEDQEWQPVPPSAGYPEGGRGIGMDDLARSLGTGQEHRASGALALHVLDVMETLLTAAREGRSLPVGTPGAAPAALDGLLTDW